MVDQSLAFSIGGSEEPKKLETEYTVDEGGCVVHVEREDCSAPINFLDFDLLSIGHAASEYVPRRSPLNRGRPATCISDGDAVP